MHHPPRSILSTEANLSSHLTISYSAAPTASGVPAPAAGADAPAADSPLGFLAALVDQLLAGGPVTTATIATSSAGTSVPQPSGIGLNAATSASVQNTLRGLSLLTKLTKQLDALKDQLDNGQTPDPQLLTQIGQTAEALAALIAPQAPPPTIDPTATLNPLASIDGTADMPTAGPLAGLADTAKKPFAGAKPADQIAQFLASLGLPPASISAASETGTPATEGSNDGISAPAQPLPAIAELAAKLADLSAGLGPIAPDVAKQLQALTQKLGAADSDPQALAQLTAATGTGAGDLDQIVRALLDAKPAAAKFAAPQIAAPTRLEVPAPIAPTQPQAPIVVPVAQTPPKSIAATASLKPPADTSSSVSTAKPEAKIIATAVAKADPQPATPDNSVQIAAAAVAPAATAAARGIPAAYQAATNPINMAQVAFEMVRQAHQGTSRFNIRIDPPELGRVDVRMHVDAAGNVNARLSVERSETLDMFQRDRGSLEKALAQAGLDTGKTNLEFSLKQNPFAGMSGGDQRPGTGAQPSRFSTVASDDDASIPSVTLYRGIASAGGINLFV